MMSRTQVAISDPKVTAFDRNLDLAVEAKHCRTLHFTSYKAVARRRRQSRDRK